MKQLIERLKKVLEVQNIYDIESVLISKEETEQIIEMYEKYIEPPGVSNWSQFVGAYISFHEKQTGTKPRINPQSGKALKEIIAFLKLQPKIVTDEDALKAFNYILANWGSLDKFYLHQVSLGAINKNISEILKQLKDGQKSNKNSRDELRRNLDNI